MMISTTKFALGFALSLMAGSAVLAQPEGEPDAGWFGKCLRCEWDPWGGPAYCAVASGTGWWGCLAVGYQCTPGGRPGGKETPAWPPPSRPLRPAGLAAGG